MTPTPTSPREEEFFSLAPKYRTKKRLAELLAQERAATEKRMREEFLRIVNDESAIDGQYLEPSHTRKCERERITERLDEMVIDQALREMKEGEK